MGADIATEAHRVRTADGLALEAELRRPPAPRARVLLCHPHPAHGGSMRSLVTSELFRSLPDAGLAALRFNFRGVEGSEGTHGGGRPERADVLAALDLLCATVDAAVTVVAGWSFGADVSLAVTDPRIDGWSPVAPPLRVLPPDELVAGADPRPKLLVVPEHDQFRPPASARAATAGWSNTTVEEVAGADHFLAGRTARVAELIVGFAASLSPPVAG